MVVNMRKKATGSRTEKIMARRLRRRRRASSDSRVRLNPPRGGAAREERSRRSTADKAEEDSDEEDIAVPVESVGERVSVLLVRFMLTLPEWELRRRRWSGPRRRPPGHGW